MNGWLTANAEMILIGYLITQGAFVWVRGVLHVIYEYTLVDTFLGTLEIAFLIWLVTVVAR